MRGELEGRQSDQREARDALRDSERAISDANRALHALEADARAARAALATLAAKRGEQERALTAGEGALGRLLAAHATTLAGRGAPEILRLALSGENLADAARQLHYFTYLSRAAAEVIEARRGALAELSRLRQQTEEKTQALGAIEAQARADRETLLAQRREQRRILERVSGELRQARRRLQQLAADESRLSRLVEEIGKLLTERPAAGFRSPAKAERQSGPDDSAAATLFSKLRGRLRFPVRGELAQRFGAGRGGGATSAKGVFIRAAEGDQVRSVAAGRVVYADWMRGFGNLLIVDHGEAYLSVYGNNESLLKQTGDPVASGEPLATVGASGGNEQTGLYFEMRHQGRPFDPLGWVKLK